MYKMEVYRAEEKTLFRTEKANNLEYFDRYKNRTNYKIKIFQKVKNRWKLIYSEQQIKGIFYRQIEKKQLSAYFNERKDKHMKKYNFTVEWEKGSINDNIIKFLKENNISFHYNHFGTLVADLYGIGQYFKFDYEHINGNTYGITAVETNII